MSRAYFVSPVISISESAINSRLLLIWWSDLTFKGGSNVGPFSHCLFYHHNVSPLWYDAWEPFCLGRPPEGAYQTSVFATSCQRIDLMIFVNILNPLASQAKQRQQTSLVVGPDTYARGAEQIERGTYLCAISSPSGSWHVILMSTHLCLMHYLMEWFRLW
jgi:hypothetical protein